MSTSNPNSFRTDIQSGTLVVIADNEMGQRLLAISLETDRGRRLLTEVGKAADGIGEFCAYANTWPANEFATFVAAWPVGSWLSSDSREKVPESKHEPDFKMETEFGALCVYAYHDREEFSLYINLAAEKSGDKRMYCVAIIREPEKDCLTVEMHTDPDWNMIDGKFNQRCIFPVKLWKEAGWI